MSIHQGKKLKELIELKYKSVVGFAKDLGVTGPTIYTLYEKKQIDKAKLCLACILLKTDPEEFGVEPDYFSSNYSIGDESEFIYQNENNFNSNYLSFFQRYFDLMDKYVIKRAKKSLTVLDYLPSKQGIDLQGDKEEYHKKNAEYFIAVEKLLTQYPFFNYLRLCQLPIENNYNDIFEEKIEYFLELLSQETFTHYYKCFKFYNDSFKLYLIGSPARLFKYFIVDKKYIITQYDRYDKNKIPIPDMVFVNKKIKPNDMVAKLITCHKADINRVINKEPHLSSRKKVSKDDLLAGLYRIERKIETQLKEIHTKYGVLCRDLKKFSELNNELRLNNKKSNSDYTEKIERMLNDKALLNTKISKLELRQKGNKEKLTLVAKIDRIEDRKGLTKKYINIKDR